MRLIAYIEIDVNGSKDDGHKEHNLNRKLLTLSQMLPEVTLTHFHPNDST